MFWLKAVGGALLVLVGLLWIGQGLNLLGGYAVLGLVVAAVGAWLLWSALAMGAARNSGKESHP